MDIEENISKINEHIERVKEYLEYGMPYSEYLDLQISFETILNELEKEDKIINLMANELYLNNALDCDYKEFKDNKCKKNNDEPNKKVCIKCIIEYFTNKVEEDK